MERSAPQLFESDKDKKASKEKNDKSDSTGKAVRSLSSVLRLQSEKEGTPRSPRPVEKKLAFIAGKYTELPGAQSEKASTPTEAKETRQKDVERPASAEETATAQTEITTEREHRDTDTPVEMKPAGPEYLQKAAAEAEEDDDEPEAYEKLPERELPPNAFYGGEFVDLSSAAEERVILLHDIPANETTADVRVAAEVPETQPEQQPEAYEEEPIAEPELPMPGGGEVPPIKPPENAGEIFGEPDEPEPERPTFRPRAFEMPPRPEPAQVYRAYMQHEAATRQVQAEQPGISKEELDDAVYRATKYGQNRGLLTGLLVGGAYEHFKHKRREKKAEKRAKEQRKQLESARRDYRFGLEEQERQRAELGVRLGATERRVTTAERRLAEQQLTPQEMAPQTVRQPEQTNVAPAEQLVVPSEHRVETSAWLSAEIDKKTGRVVEQPTFQYGHEYYRERAQETLPSQHRHVAAGGVALMGAGGAAGQPGSDDATLPQPQVPIATMQGNPSKVHSQQGTNSSQRKLSESLANAAPLWPWVLALIGIVVVLIVVLR